MKISNSKAKTYTECRNKYKYKFRWDIEPKQKAIQLHRGSWLHGLLQPYMEGEDWREVHEELQEEFESVIPADVEDVDITMPDECYRIMESYEYQWHHEDEDMEVIATELEFGVEIAHGHIFTVRIDAITQDDLGTWIWEHKSHDKFPSADQRFMDIQTARYWFACVRHPTLPTPTGVVWDYLLTRPPTKPKQNQNGALSRRKIKTDVLTFIRALREYGIDPREHKDTILRLKDRNDFFKRDRFPIDRNVVEHLMKEMIYVADEIETGFRPIRTIGRHCTWCDFQPLCMAELHRGDITYLMRQYQPREGGGSGYEEEAPIYNKAGEVVGTIGEAEA